MQLWLSLFLYRTIVIVYAAFSAYWCCDIDSIQSSGCHEFGYVYFGWFVDLVVCFEIGCACNTGRSRHRFDDSIVKCGQTGGKTSLPLKTAEHALQPWVAFVILPLFAFVNAGVSLKGVTIATLMQTIPFGIIMGLVVGKAIGIFSASWLMIKFTSAQLPASASWTQFWCVCIVRSGIYDELIYRWLGV